MLFVDFLASLPPCAPNAHALDRQARKSGGDRDPFATPATRELASKLVAQYEGVFGGETMILSDEDWRALVVKLRAFSDADWAALQRNRAPVTTPTEVPTAPRRRSRKADVE